MARVYIKVTVWERYEIPEDKIDELKAKFESGEITTGEDIAVDYNVSMDYVDDTSTDVKVEDNGGYSTIEFMTDDNDMIWENGKSEVV